jgi:hypothetical protein
LPLASRKAYLAFEWVQSKARKKLEDKEAWDLLKEEGIPSDAGNAGELTDYKPPAFDTWARELRTARSALGEQKYTARGGRARGRSIVRTDEVERWKQDDE